MGSFCVATRRAIRVDVLLAAWALLIPALMADSTPWGVQNITQTGIPLSQLSPVLATNGNIYLVGGSGGSISVEEVGVTGRQVFSVTIAGVSPLALDTIIAGQDGNLYLTGDATADQFVTTPGAYESAPSGNATGFICKLSGADGHVIFCTYVDVSFPGLNGLAVDPAGNSYFASIAGTPCSNSPTLNCIEKLNSPGTALVYETALGSFGDVAFIAADANGNLFVAGGTETGIFLAKLDAAGVLEAAVSGNSNEQVAGLQVDSAGNPQVLIQPMGANTASVVRKYNSALSAVLFETPVSGFLPMLMLIDSSGTTTLLGGTDSVNFPLVNPTAACSLPSSPETAEGATPGYAQGVLVRVDDAGNLVQSTFLPGTPGVESAVTLPNGATVVVDDTVSGQIAVLTLGPVPEIQLGCLGNAASFLAGPLAPEEIVTLFGQGLGPAAAVSGQPAPDGRYPFQLAGTEVSFDGVAAPVFYVSSNQINAVTPLELEGKSTTHVCVVVNGTATNCVDEPVQPATPGIFLSSASSVPYAAALNQDGSINSQDNPAPVGSIVSIFATGLGSMIPAPPDGGLIGLPLPVQSLEVSMSTVQGLDQQTNSYIFGPVNVLYAGPAPNEIEGLSQINFQVPGGAILIQVSSGTFNSGTTDWVNIWTKPSI